MNTDPAGSAVCAATSTNAVRRVLPAALGVAAMALAALGTPMAQGQSPNGELKDVSKDDLKRLYLSCDRAASSGQLNSTGIMRCSVVYEELRLRAFGGDFDKLRAWSRAQPSERDDRR